MSRKNLKDVELTKKVGSVIRILRQTERWNLDEMSAMLGTSMPALSKIETGATDISISRLQMIADLFGVNAAYLLGEATNDGSQELLAELQQARDDIHKKDQQIIALQSQMIKLLSTDVARNVSPEYS